MSTTAEKGWFYHSQGSYQSELVAMFVPGDIFHKFIFLVGSYVCR